MITKIAIGAINFYQRFLSFDTGVLAVFASGGACKYQVSCSEYTKQAIMKYGLGKGIWKGISRILSCR